MAARPCKEWGHDGPPHCGPPDYLFFFQREAAWAKAVAGGG